MTLIKEYSEKEKAIFKGIMDLLNQGHRIHELKVSDIAAAAGIGKGTVYEYFSTKEEILRQAVSYYVYKEFEAFSSLINNQFRFEEIIYRILNHTVEMLKAGLPAFYSWWLVWVNRILSNLSAKIENSSLRFVLP